MKNNLFELKVWHKAIDMCEKVYKITENFPAEEKYGLTSQLRRSAVSTASNIAEGAGRFSKGEFKQFLGMANGSGYELRITNYGLRITNYELYHIRSFAH